MAALEHHQHLVRLKSPSHLWPAVEEAGRCSISSPRGLQPGPEQQFNGTNRAYRIGHNRQILHGVNRIVLDEGTISNPDRPGDPRLVQVSLIPPTDAEDRVVDADGVLKQGSSKPETRPERSYGREDWRVIA